MNINGVWYNIAKSTKRLNFFDLSAMIEYEISFAAEDTKK
jgi:hypothetical protein